MSETSNSRIYGIAVTILLLLSAALGWFFWQKSQAIQSESKQREAVLDSLVQVKLDLQRALDSMALDYSSLRTENENLQGRVTNTAALIEQKEIVIRQIKSEKAQNTAELQRQIADLQKVKTEYETIITVLRQENLQLQEDNQRLTDENTQLQGQVADMAKQLEEQIRKTQSAAFKASSFRVDVERRNDKLTVRARQARELLISFDLADVPQVFHGPQKLYLTITDDQGNPIASENPIKATVYAPSGPVELLAQQVKQVVLETTQRLSFVHKLEDKLKSGHYVAAIYCDKGLLGASSFRLR